MSRMKSKCIFENKVEMSRIKSDSKFFQRDKCMLFLDFHLMKLVFLATVRAMRSLSLVASKLSSDKSPSRQSKGDNGMR